MRRMGKGAGNMLSVGKSKAQEISGEMTNVTFDDVGGTDEVEVELKEIIEFLKNPDAFTRLGAKLPKGILLVGPPGTGKTLLAKATAGEAAVPFFSMWRFSSEESSTFREAAICSRVNGLPAFRSDSSTCIRGVVLRSFAPASIRLAF